MSPTSKILEYIVYFEPLAEGGYEVFFPVYPEIITYGRNLSEARKMAKDALRCHLEGLAKDSQPFISRTRFALKREKINIAFNPA